MAQGSGLRPWKRGTEAARAALAAILPNGDLIVTNEGNVYAGDGSTATNALSRLLKKSEGDTTYASFDQGRRIITDYTTSQTDVTVPTGAIGAYVSMLGSGGGGASGRRGA